MSEFEISNDAVECDRCGEVFTDESSYVSHGEVDHGDREEDFEEVADRTDLIMNPSLTEADILESRRVLAETNQQELHHSIPFKNPKARIPKTQEPHNSADDLVAGMSGYNPNPNAGLYDNVSFKKGSAGDRGDVLGESTANEDQDHRRRL